jgi:hypothetical protein
MTKPEWATDPDKVLEEQRQAEAVGGAYAGGCATIVTVIVTLLLVIGAICGIVAVLR